MALLVKEQKALQQLEDAFKEYYRTLLDKEIYIDTNKTVEERLLFLASELCL